MPRSRFSLTLAAFDHLSNFKFLFSQADVVINSTSSALGLDGSISKSLVVAAGPQFQQECEDFTRNNGNIGKWNYTKTKAGNLNCKEVFHVHLGAYDPTVN